jgi:anti-anti-sigma regulatory factor
VSFLGSAGLHALVLVKHAADRRGLTFIVTGAQGYILDVLDNSGLSWLLDDHHAGPANEEP